MKKLLENFRGEVWEPFADLAMQLKILAADEVKVTDQGLELVMKKDSFKQEKKKRPVRRKF